MSWSKDTMSRAGTFIVIDVARTLGRNVVIVVTTLGHRGHFQFDLNEAIEETEDGKAN